MKTKELIEMLQNQDPSGETEVCVGNAPISFVSKEDAYYDGRLRTIIRDENGNVVGCKFVAKGDKVQIYTIDFDDLMFEYADNPNFKIDCSELAEYNREETAKRYEEIRQFSKKVSDEIEVELFQNWAIEKAEKLNDGIDKQEIKRMATELYRKSGLSYLDKLPKDGTVGVGKSYNQTRCEQWESMFEIYTEDGFVMIRKR